LAVAVYFFSNYYMALILAFVAGAVAAVSLFFISKEGYAAVSPYVVTVFMTATALGTIYGAFPSVFRQTENVAENKALYLRYVALQNEILSYSATAKDANAKPISASAYIAYIDRELNRSNNVAVGFDETKLPAFKFEAK
jgi:predicted PurR-regulated permease PerM